MLKNKVILVREESGLNWLLTSHLNEIIFLKESCSVDEKFVVFIYHTDKLGLRQLRLISNKFESHYNFRGFVFGTRKEIVKKWAQENDAIKGNLNNDYQKFFVRKIKGRWKL